MKSPTFVTKYASDANRHGGQASQQTIRSHTPAPVDIFEHSTYEQPFVVPRPANRYEIYGLALGVCFLILLLSWLLFLGVQGMLRSLTEHPSRVDQKDDPERGEDGERGDMTEGLQTPDERPSLLSSLRKVSADDLIQRARRKSLNVATGLKRDMGSLRRVSCPTPVMDEEALVGGQADGSGYEAGGSFLRRIRRTGDAPPV